MTRLIIGAEQGEEAGLLKMDVVGQNFRDALLRGGSASIPTP
jgi:hypothetical protein